MSVVRIFLRKVPASKNVILSPANFSRIIFCDKSSKIESTSDVSDNETSSKTTIKQKLQDSSSSSSSTSSSDDEIYAKTSETIPQNDKSTLETKNPPRNEALEKLNLLLKQMVEEPVQKPSQIGQNLARPANKREQKVTKKPETTEQKLVNAAKSVAESLGGDIKQTENELLTKLKAPVENRADLSDILKGMRIDREPKQTQDTSRSNQVKQILERVAAKTGASAQTSAGQFDRKPRRMGPRKMTATAVTEKINLFEGESLGIFTNDPSKYKDSPQLETWQKLDQRDLKLAVTHPPSNYFQEMILWTEQGKLWKFPIDNEYGLDEESKVYFADHVFLERHLEPWCPRKGPIRHFMELVCIGLSKNPYITVETKKEHIEWYKNYFEDKKKLLKEIGAIPIEDDRDGKPKEIDG